MASWIYWAGRPLTLISSVYWARRPTVLSSDCWSNSNRPPDPESTVLRRASFSMSCPYFQRWQPAASTPRRPVPGGEPGPWGGPCPTSPGVRPPYGGSQLSEVLGCGAAPRQTGLSPQERDAAGRPWDDSSRAPDVRAYPRQPCSPCAEKRSGQSSQALE